MEERDLIFNNPHFTVLLFGSDVDTVLFFLWDFLCLSCLLLVFSLFFVFLGADTVSMEMGFWGGSRRREAAERRVRLQLCFLVPTLDSHILGGLINWSIFLKMRAAPSSGMDAVSPNKTRFPPEGLPIIYEAHIVSGTPLRQPAI